MTTRRRSMSAPILEVTLEHELPIEPQVLRLSRCASEVVQFIEHLEDIGEVVIFEMRGERVVLWEAIEPYSAAGSEPSAWGE
ncbi:MAG TPA: hypothetical protein VG757_01870 [Devosia sp.]|nr:hypothetical protein [Devosia sp.]